MGAKNGGFVEKVGVPVVILIWYSCSVVGNNAGKVVLPLFPYPYSLSIIQFAIGSCSVPFIMLLRGRPVMPLLAVLMRSKDRGLMLGLCGICSNLFMRVALLFISVSFTHTVKASQPLFSAVLSWVLLGQHFSRASIASLFVISGGVALSALTEFQFHPLGFLAATFSAFSMSVANTYQKRLMYKAKDLPPSTLPLTNHGGTGSNGGGGGVGNNGSHGESNLTATSGATSTSLDKNELFFLANFYSCALMLPLWWFIDGRRMLLGGHADLTMGPATRDGTGLGEDGLHAPAAALGSYVLCMVLANTVPMVLQHFVSLAILSLLSPVSHSIVNSFKRIVVISLSVLYFRNPVSLLNAFGMVCALGGVFLYQRSLPPIQHQPGKVFTKDDKDQRSWLEYLSTPPSSPRKSPSKTEGESSDKPDMLNEKGVRYEEP
mmetsp:Transcript_13734/g.25290  ORF Transcript_13734/g.25290 Transcript_13734/m.25290 type:complete len:433 (+) Transcript_13734:217-1515(+)